MTDTFTNEGEQINEGGNENANLKHLREQADRAKALDAELAASKRELAVLKSGIDADHPLGKFFVEHFDGDITDTAALLEQAKAMGVPMRNAPGFDGTEQTSQTNQGEGERQVPVTQHGEREVLEPTGTNERRALAGEGNVSGEEIPDPNKIALEEAQAAIDGGATFEQGAGHMVARLAQAAQAGDRRVIISEERGSDGKVRQRW